MSTQTPAAKVLSETKPVVPRATQVLLQKKENPKPEKK